ncbi:Histidine kinase [Aquimarina amphilecti]|uniref:Histidine kinase n=1 Tax=Aquimarina amphilecti TaxID=1038014 RepID=A0A1H7HNJ7_AQUAM|nr:sensor histidine kinase [Aquimarina amphilecti]SEK49795.1 Histidine kinase [Aquimarina amphilecti]
MSKLDTWIDNKLLQNILVWLFLMIIFLMVIQAENRLLASAAIIAFIMPPIYINNLKILPFFFKNKRTLGIVLFILNIIIFTFLGVALLSRFFENFQWKMLLNVFGAVLLIILFGTALKLARDSFYRRQEEKEAELKLLKAQLNPHFLFNTLNNLYGLSVVKSDKLPSLMLKLSDLLRYSLYETKETFVSLDKEIKYLENYISLEKIRLEDKADIQLNITGHEESNKIIAPMLFIVFVENAFKHLGVLEGVKSKVSIDIDIKEDSLDFKCMNTIDSIHIMNNDLEKGKSGIGLQNAKKRLDLMYTDKYELDTTQEKDFYQVALTLKF